MASICGSPVCAGGKPKLKFTYTGDYVVRKDGVVELLTSGTIVFLEPKVIDVFMVGGGGGGASQKAGTSTAGGFGGGGGGYTVTARRRSVNGSYLVTIGAGGSAMSDGAATSFGTELTAQGGKSHQQSEDHYSRIAGSAGGSGGGGGVASNSDYGTGGSDGANGESGYPTNHKGGAGQGYSTREFGEPTGKLYAGGGGGGRYMSASSPVVSMGGAGGGGAGAWYGVLNNVGQAPSAGGANTGGGGGGGAMNDEAFGKFGASGGSGIVCFRDAAELPELAGTWVLNERLYAPENTINQTIQFTAKESAAATPQEYANFYSDTSALKFTRATGFTTTVYTYSSDTWNTKYKYLTFPAGATGSDEFRAWLASNATKQA